MSTKRERWRSIRPETVRALLRDLDSLDEARQVLGVSGVEVLERAMEGAPGEWWGWLVDHGFASDEPEDGA